MTKETILAMFPFYGSASASERRALAENAVTVHLAAGDSFYREEEMIDSFGLVGRGDIRVFKTASNGREWTLYHVRDGEPCLINMIGVFLATPAMASAVVEAPTAAVVVPATVFRNLLTRSDALQRFVFATMASRLIDVMALVEEVSIRRMDERLASWLMHRFTHQQPDPVIPVTHEQLAAELGTAREVMSRLLKEFERKGAIVLARGRVTLVDARLLSNYVGRPDEA